MREAARHNNHRLRCVWPDSGAAKLWKNLYWERKHRWAASHTARSLFIHTCAVRSRVHLSLHAGGSPLITRCELRYMLHRRAGHMRSSLQAPLHCSPCPPVLTWSRNTCTQRLLTSPMCCWEGSMLQSPLNIQTTATALQCASQRAATITAQLGQMGPEYSKAKVFFSSRIIGMQTF